MTAASIKTMVPTHRADAPRGALAAAQVVHYLLDLLAAAKSRREHRAALRDIESLTRYANLLRASQPSLAADLLAAVDRSPY